MNRERLEVLIQVLEEVEKRDATQDHKHFDMGSWAEYYTMKDGHGTPDCGTVACAFGWMGLSEYGTSTGLEVKGHEVYFGDEYGVDAAVSYFDISGTSARRLFLPHNYSLWERERYVDGGAYPRITPRDVIKRVKVLLG